MAKTRAARKLKDKRSNPASHRAGNTLDCSSTGKKKKGKGGGLLLQQNPGNQKGANGEPAKMTQAYDKLLIRERKERGGKKLHLFFNCMAAEKVKS